MLLHEIKSRTLPCFLFFLTLAAAGCGPQEGEVTDTGGEGATSSVEFALTGTQINSAINWFATRKGATTFKNINGQTILADGHCELAVETSFGRIGAFPSATATYLYAKNKGYLRTSGTPPKGASVFYNTSAAGHIALSTGDGHVWSTSVGHGIGNVGYTYFQNYRGWAMIPWK